MLEWPFSLCQFIPLNYLYYLYYYYYYYYYRANLCLWAHRIYAYTYIEGTSSQHLIMALLSQKCWIFWKNTGKQRRLWTKCSEVHVFLSLHCHFQLQISLDIIIYGLCYSLTERRVVYWRVGQPGPSLFAHNLTVLNGCHRGPVCGLLVFLLPIAIKPFALFHHSVIFIT